MKLRWGLDETVCDQKRLALERSDSVHSLDSVFEGDEEVRMTAAVAAAEVNSPKALVAGWWKIASLGSAAHNLIAWLIVAEVDRSQRHSAMMAVVVLHCSEVGRP